MTGLLGAGCGGGDRPPAPDRLFVAEAPEVAAMASLPDGGLLLGERVTGRILRADRSGTADAAPVTTLPVSVEGQRGLLGLAVDGTGQAFAAWTEPGGRIQVGQVAPGPTRIVWDGPMSAEAANGGHLAFDSGGGLVIGIGDLLSQPKIDDPAFPHGKLLRLDPAGAPAQQPELVSSGWNNPFAFTIDDEGRLWVADNTPGDTPERLARGDAGPRATDITVLPAGTAPSGLAVRGDTLAVCGYLTRTLVPYRIAQGGPPEPAGGVLADDCRLGVATLSDGRLAYSTGQTIRILPAP